MQMNMPMNAAWMFMQDGILFDNVNHQGGPRGGNQFVVPSRLRGRQPDGALGHHTFDSTHIAFGVLTVAVDRGPWVLEGSLFNGREPDEHRWDFDFGSSRDRTIST